ncbi:hypothetical protein [Thiopseudomonas alkaliphila]|uniref:hypothetical protein n=1 Tax=Thiopseudomonas alkaliphila TaxID=1697053 RepID=UPI0025761977|nr:hypothetical protein [Thiopseudomonas alkaliphila]MDM1708911.1 hypothetical protein [Thiopseudomonas alkaliphila]
MFDFKRFLLILFLLSGSSVAWGYWYDVPGKGIYAPAHASEACGAVGFSYPPGSTHHSFKTVIASNGSVVCRWSYSNKDGYANYVDHPLSRSQNQSPDCPAETIYINLKGECILPEPDAPEIESFEFLFCYNYSGGDDCEAGTKQEVPREICKNGYVYEPSYSSEYTSCYGITSSSPAIYCSSVADLTSKTCSSEYQKQPADNSCPEGKKAGQVNGKFYCAGGEDVNGGDLGGGETGGGETGGGETGGGETGGGEGGSSGGGETGDGEGEGGSSGGGSGGGGSGSGGGSGGGGSGSGGEGSGGGGSGSGSGEGTGEGTGQGESVDGCENCSFGDERGDPFDGEVPSFSESLNRATDAMKKSPIAQSIGKISFPSGGSCPVGNTAIETPLGTIPLSFVEHCELWEKISPVLSAVFLAFWALLSVRVFLSA